jgi:hypothetical protein
MCLNNNYFPTGWFTIKIDNKLQQKFKTITIKTHVFVAMKKLVKQ